MSIKGEPELVAKNIPGIHSKTLTQSRFDWLKKVAKQCNRCGEMFLTDLPTQSYCQECRGGEMGMNDYYRFKETWAHGPVITPILEDMRR